MIVLLVAGCRWFAVLEEDKFATRSASSHKFFSFARYHTVLVCVWKQDHSVVISTWPLCNRIGMRHSIGELDVKDTDVQDIN